MIIILNEYLLIQSVSAVAPVELVDVSGGHVIQSCWLASGWYIPRGHSSQADWSGRGRSPASHAPIIKHKMFTPYIVIKCIYW